MANTVNVDLKQKIYKILIALLKNILAFAVGGILGLFTVVLFAKPLLEHIATKDVGLGIIALAPVVLLISAFIFAAIGGITAVIAYNVIKFIKYKKEQRKTSIK
ncbi:MAG: hypothetical protein AAB378_02710 [Patescibacteria group bacterium]